MGFDPGARGCQVFESTDFVVHRRKIDVSTHLVLLQPGAVGVTRYHTSADGNRRGLGVLADQLLLLYPPTHDVVIYELAMLPMMDPRIERIALRDLALADVRVYSTLYVPPLEKRPVDGDRLARVGLRIDNGVVVRA